MTDDTDECGLDWAAWWIPSIDESYPKPKILSPLEEQDRVWKLLVQAAKN